MHIGTWNHIDLPFCRLHDESGTPDSARALDDSVLVDDVVEWSLYGVVRGGVSWGSDWTDLSKAEIDELEVSGVLEHR